MKRHWVNCSLYEYVKASGAIVKLNGLALASDYLPNGGTKSLLICILLYTDKSMASGGTRLAGFEFKL
jgi:hypothetical protein